MSDVIIPQRWLARGGTEANLEAVNEVPYRREVIVVRDSDGKWYFKVGDGLTAYSDLPYAGIYPAELIPYDNTTSSLTATDAQAAIDELAAGGGAGGGGSATDPSASVYVLRDFYQSIAGSTATGTSFVDAQIAAYIANGGQLTRAASPGRPAQVSLDINTTASSRVRMALTDGLQIVPGGGVIRIGTSINLPALSNATDRYQITFGLLDRIDGAPANRVYATYTDNVNSGAWQLQAFNAGVAASAVNGTATPTAGVDQRVEIEINAAGTQAELFVNGVSQGTIAISFSTACALMLNIDRTSGNSNKRSVLCNYAYFQQTFTTTR